MASAVFKGASEEECIKNACSSLNIDAKDLVYTIIEEKRLLFRKSVSISVNLPETIGNNENDGTVKVEDGKIIAKNPIKDGKPAVIKSSPDITLLINEKKINAACEVYEESSIEIILPETAANRNLDIKINQERTEAYLSISYEPKNLYKLKDIEESNMICLESEIKEKTYPPIFTLEEIKREITKKGIVFGLIEENIQKCSQEKNSLNVLIAKGTTCLNDEDDKININFQTEKNIENFAEDNKGKIDFKSIGSVSAVYNDDILAVRITGKIGHDGKDIFGKEMKHKTGKKIRLKVGTGCTLKDENTVVASISGKPCIKNNTFYVYEIHEIVQNVDLTTGNIKFIGDVIIHGDVKEGMKVEAGNSIIVEHNIEQAELIAKGNIQVKGNVISSTVVAGGEDVEILRNLEITGMLQSLLKELITTIEEVKKFNLLGYDTPDGKIIKLLIEQKFKKIPQLCLKYLTICTMKKSESGFEDTLSYKLMKLIKEKLMGLAPLSIKSYGEIDDIVNLMDKEIEFQKSELSLPVNVNISYCQDSEVKSSGDIIVTGKGVYVSKVTAFNAIYFTEDKSVVRGGYLKADNEIKCKIVGTVSGVETNIAVGEKGHIYSEIAYQNTKFSVGNKDYTMDVAGKNIHVYINDNCELTVDMLKL